MNMRLLLLAKTAVLAFGVMLSVACSTGGAVSEEISIRNPAFSADSNTLLFDYCKGSECDLVAYSIEGKQFYRLVPAEHELLFAGASAGGAPNLLAGVLRFRKSDFTSYPQIVLIDLNSNTYRRLTDDPSHKYGPSLSFDNKSVAYIQSHRQRTWFSGSPRATGWDVHVLDTRSGVDTRATNYCFYALSKPFIAPDNGDLIFSGEGAMCNYPETATTASELNYKAYREQFGEDNIIRFGSGRPHLEPWLTTRWKHASGPSIARNGDVLFYSRTNELDGIQKGYYNYDLFLKRGEQLTRLTWLKSFLGGSALAPDSRYAAYISDPQRDRQTSLWLLNIETGETQQVSLVPLMVEFDRLSVRMVGEAQ
ncbi:hypothetical protein [Dechloromonas sp. CZR5]|uniref:hypothetical protein n=1 Tax=Dechloromonas sp. CZR5 TaxID=2608630 RepID=UPI00123CC15E|nr:hypothetical protein [Dechloromonas sp. CZR5]